jgi:hypothetical protein
MTTPHPAPRHHSLAALPAIALLAAGAPCAAQSALFSNGNPANADDPGFALSAVTRAGEPAPGASLWSELSADATGASIIAGVSGHLSSPSGPYRFAEDFTVPNPGWWLDAASFYAYQPGASGGLSPFASINVRVWSGTPGEPGSFVVQGDTATNRLTGATATGIYRIFHSTALPLTPAVDPDRLIWRAEASLPRVLLRPGVYWLDWQFASADLNAGVYVPPVFPADARTLPGANARQFVSGAGGSWKTIADPGKPASAADVPLALPFILRGDVRCPADLDDGSGTATPDAGVTIEDLVFFLSAFAAGELGADLDDGSGLGVPDQGVTIDDLVYFLQHFGAGC